MRRVANLLIFIAGALWLATSGFVESSGQAFAQDANPKKAQEAARKAAMEAERKAVMEARLNAELRQRDANIQQFEQQLAPQFRQLYRTELHFMRVVCQPSKQQYEKIAADGEAVLKGTVKKFVMHMHGMPGGLSAGESSDPRTVLADAIAKSVRTTLSPEQAARYQKELEQRTAARMRVVVLNLVAKVDKVLVLTAEQRGKLGEILEVTWNDSWNHTQWFMMSGQNFPQMPDTKILPILTETQKSVWGSIPKGNVRLGIDLGVVQEIEIEDEVWDEDRPQANPERAAGKAAAKDKGTTKMVEKE